MVSRSCTLASHGLKVWHRDSMFWRVSLMLRINVALPNGHVELLTLPPSSRVQDLSKKARRAFGKKNLRLITGKNRILVHLDKTLEEAEIQDGECLTALVLLAQLAATNSAFAVWCHGDRAIVTWGDRRCGGDSNYRSSRSAQGCAADSCNFSLCCGSGRQIRRYLGWARQRRSRFCGCAANSGHGRGLCCDSGRWMVVTWGDRRYGGDSSTVREQLRGVEQIQGADRSFAGGSGRWIRRYLGWSRRRRWQFQNTRLLWPEFATHPWADLEVPVQHFLKSAQGCPADSSHR